MAVLYAVLLMLSWPACGALALLLVTRCRFQPEARPDDYGTIMAMGPFAMLVILVVGVRRATSGMNPLGLLRGSPAPKEPKLKGTTK